MHVKVIHCLFLISILLEYFVMQIVCISPNNHVKSNTDIAPTGKKIKRMLRMQLEKFKQEIHAELPRYHVFYLDWKPIYKQYIEDPELFKYLDQGYYVTLYDLQKKCPVYSAYELDFSIKDEVGGRRRWMRHPFLTVNEQPKLKDYNGIGRLNFSRGHLYPRRYAPTKLMKQYTNLITNIAIQYLKFNINTWKRMENALYKASYQNCNSNGDNIYFVTGVIPSNVNTHNGIHIPDYFWTAVCCDTSNSIPASRKTDGWSFAYIAENRNEASLDVKMYFVEDFLRESFHMYDQIFMHLKQVKGCLFNPTMTFNIIKQIIHENNKDRFYLKGDLFKVSKRHRGRSKSAPPRSETFFQQLQKMRMSISDYFNG